MPQCGAAMSCSSNLPGRMSPPRNRPPGRRCVGRKASQESRPETLRNSSIRELPCRPACHADGTRINPERDREGDDNAQEGNVAGAFQRRGDERRRRAGAGRGPVVARDGWAPRREGQFARQGLQRVAERIQGGARLQGQLHRNDDRRDCRVPGEAAAAHRAGVRSRHGFDDGCQGRHLSGVSADEGQQAAVQSVGLSADGHRLLLRQQGQHAVDAVQQLDAGAVLQQGSVQEGRPGSEHAAQDLARDGRVREEIAGRGREMRLYHRLAVLGATRELLGLA